MSTAKAGARTERPILFSSPMVRAILDGTKRQTRRMVKPQPPEGYDFVEYVNESATSFCARFENDGPRDQLGMWTKRCPYGTPGDRLWVRESYWRSECGRYFATGPIKANSPAPDVYDRQTGTWYREERRTFSGFDDPQLKHCEGPHVVTGWTNQGRRTKSGRYIEAFDVSFADADPAVEIKPFTGNALLRSYRAEFRRHIPSIHVPRIASRINLLVESVRVKRLHDITEDDAKAEGLQWASPTWGVDGVASSWNADPREAFAALWRDVNGADSWSANPWVWVIGFKRI